MVAYGANNHRTKGGAGERPRKDAEFADEAVRLYQVLLWLPCYDFTPVINPTFDGCSLAVSSPASGIFNSHGVTGGVYKTRERIHRNILICDY